MTKSYDRIMQKLTLTDEMSARILEAVEKKASGEHKVLRFPVWKKYLAAAACLVLIAGILAGYLRYTPRPDVWSLFFAAVATQMQQRLQQMEQLLASMTAVNPQSTAPAADRLVTDKDVEEYGESIDMMRKVTREELGAVAQRIAAIEATLRQMQVNVVPQVQAVAQRQQMSAEQQFWADLAAAVPNFRQVNDLPDFQTWLLEADPLTGVTRQTFLDDAQRALDARRVASFFRTWLESTGQAAVAQSTGDTPRYELEKQVSPGRSRSTGTPASANQGKVYTPQDIQKFFNDVRAGKYKGREQERSRIERDIFAAQRENRIQVTA